MEGGQSGVTLMQSRLRLDPGKRRRLLRYRHAAVEHLSVGRLPVHRLNEVLLLLLLLLLKVVTEELAVSVVVRLEPHLVILRRRRIV